ncbi:unnamed protein product [Parascedosporium putredinis]|uniref:Heterokaryon incompatibility domain-containing protein n=1 Tax=Parascedosporium putredinis TaxID=1442378 RepID=A0A9P1M6V0_9PEZI|nr:unnamed protein product [Parascedosporium putredinis]CAI7989191.1 unnamed protein product [Parascedosporium putredinis]
MASASNVSRLEQHIPADELPQTITDAMWLTRRLGLSFLWVDRLCIVQDDEAEKDEHVRNMAYVFANAYLTIIAACGNANARLGGLDKKSVPKTNNKTPSASHLDLVAESKWNSRAWTVEEALYPRAFAGVTSILSKVFTGGLVWGLPVMFLEAALLWQPQVSIRRKVLPLGASQLNALPSWSWMGWYFDGIPVDILLWRAAGDYVESSAPVKRVTRLASNGLQYRGKSSRRLNPLPDGWSRVGADFKHESDPTTIFRYPVVVPPTKGPEQLVMAPSLPGTFLSFSTTRGFFDVKISRNQEFQGRSNPPIAIGNIYDRSGRWAGQFRGHDSWLGIQSSNHDGNEKLEFIAVSEASERGGSHVFDPEYLKDVQDSNGNIDYVNVLWIERVGEIAYRRGLGHISVQTWEVQAKEQVPILLG